MRPINLLGLPQPPKPPVISATSGLLSTSNTSFTAVPGLTATLITQGNPIFVGLIPDGGSSAASIGTNRGGGLSNSIFARFAILNGLGTIAMVDFTTQTTGLVNPEGMQEIRVPPGCVWTIDVQPPGTYTYTLQMEQAASASNVTLYSCKLVAYEL